MDIYYEIIREGFSSFLKTELRTRFDEVPAAQEITKVDTKLTDRRANDCRGDSSTGGGDGDRSRYDEHQGTGG
jgi:hypothetical protein